MSLFPANDKERKNLPVFDMLVRYFPKAMREITRVCVANNVRYSPDRAPNDINWARGKSPNQLGSLFRHMLERAVDGKVFEDVPPEVTAATGIEKVYVLAEAAWRACAELELEIEREESKAAASTLVDYATRVPVYLPTRDGAWAVAGAYGTAHLDFSVLDLKGPGQFSAVHPPSHDAHLYEFICDAVECPGHTLGVGGCSADSKMRPGEFGRDHGYRLKAVA